MSTQKALKAREYHKAELIAAFAVVANVYGYKVESLEDYNSKDHGPANDDPVLVLFRPHVSGAVRVINVPPVASDAQRLADLEVARERLEAKRAKRNKAGA